MSKYKIWNKEEEVITPIGEVLSPDEWISRYPIADKVATVLFDDVVNGGYFGIYSQMVNIYAKQGCDFSECITEQDHLNKIEEFEDNLNKPNDNVTTEERTASALEALVLLNMEDEPIVE